MGWGWIFYQSDRRIMRFISWKGLKLIRGGVELPQLAITASSLDTGKFAKWSKLFRTSSSYWPQLRGSALPPPIGLAVVNYNNPSSETSGSRQIIPQSPITTRYSVLIARKLLGNVIFDKHTIYVSSCDPRFLGPCWPQNNPPHT